MELQKNSSQRFLKLTLRVPLKGVFYLNYFGMSNQLHTGDYTDTKRYRASVTVINDRRGKVIFTTTNRI